METASAGFYPLGSSKFGFEWPERADGITASLTPDLCLPLEPLGNPGITPKTFSGAGVAKQNPSEKANSCFFHLPVTMQPQVPPIP